MKKFINWWLDELANGDPRVFLATILAFVFLLCFLAACASKLIDDPRPRNITHDAHLFIEVPHKGIIHHPNCPCGLKP